MLNSVSQNYSNESFSGLNFKNNRLIKFFNHKPIVTTDTFVKKTKALKDENPSSSILEKLQISHKNKCIITTEDGFIKAHVPGNLACASETHYYDAQTFGLKKVIYDNDTFKTIGTIEEDGTAIYRKYSNLKPIKDKLIIEYKGWDITGKKIIGEPQIILYRYNKDASLKDTVTLLAKNIEIAKTPGRATATEDHAALTFITSPFRNASSPFPPSYIPEYILGLAGK